MAPFARLSQQFIQSPTISVGNSRHEYFSSASSRCESISRTTESVRADTPHRSRTSTGPPPTTSYTTLRTTARTTFDQSGILEFMRDDHRRFSIGYQALKYARPSPVYASSITIDRSSLYVYIDRDNSAAEEYFPAIVRKHQRIISVCAYIKYPIARWQKAQLLQLAEKTRGSISPVESGKTAELAENEAARVYT